MEAYTPEEGLFPVEVESIGPELRAADAERGLIDFSVGPFRYYLQYMDKNTQNLEEYEQTDWARKHRKEAALKPLPKKRAARRSDLSTLIAEGWQPIFLMPGHTEEEVTAQMLDDYEILALSDIYDTEAAGTDTKRYAVTVIYEPVEVGMTLPNALPLLVRAKRADAEPLVTDQLGCELDASLKLIEEELGEKELTEYCKETHYWCTTFNGRYDVWQMPLPERNSVLSEYGALLFNNLGKNPYFSRISRHMMPRHWRICRWPTTASRLWPMAIQTSRRQRALKASPPAPLQRARGVESPITCKARRWTTAIVASSSRTVVRFSSDKSIWETKENILNPPSK